MIFSLAIIPDGKESLVVVGGSYSQKLRTMQQQFVLFCFEN